jgi:hypothetical protein
VGVTPQALSPCAVVNFCLGGQSAFQCSPTRAVG